MLCAADPLRRLVAGGNSTLGGQLLAFGQSFTNLAQASTPWVQATQGPSNQWLCA